MVSVVTVADHPTLLAAADPTRIGLTFTLWVSGLLNQPSLFGFLRIRE